VLACTWDPSVTCVAETVFISDLRTVSAVMYFVLDRLYKYTANYNNGMEFVKVIERKAVL
jgi:hypothetical protein